MEIRRNIVVCCLLLAPLALCAQEQKKRIEMLPGDNLEQKLLENGINLDPPITPEEIDKSVNQFIDVANFAPVKSLSEGKTLSWDESKKIKDYTRGDSYVVLLDFKTEKRYPKKYSSQNHFAENPSPEYFDKVSSEIFNDVIGPDYARYEPELLGTDGRAVGIEAVFKNEAELRTLLSLPNLIEHIHYGIKLTYQEVLPLGHN